MITIEKNKLNLIFGDVDSAKTTVILNTLTEYLKGENEVLLFSPCTKSYHIEKKLHCLVNDVDWVSVKHDRTSLKPIGLSLPSNLKVIDDCRVFNDIKGTIREVSRSSNLSLIVIDNINQMDFNLNLPYKERISKTLEILNEFAGDIGVSILGSFSLLKIANWNDVESFTSNDVNLGSMIYVDRSDRVVNIFDESVDTAFKYTISPKNMKLETKEVKLLK